MYGCGMQKITPARSAALDGACVRAPQLGDPTLACHRVIGSAPGGIATAWSLNSGKIKCDFLHNKSSHRWNECWCCSAAWSTQHMASQEAKAKPVQAVASPLQAKYTLLNDRIRVGTVQRALAVAAGGVDTALTLPVSGGRGGGDGAAGAKAPGALPRWTCPGQYKTLEPFINPVVR